jgi:hypothetical protein
VAHTISTGHPVNAMLIRGVTLAFGSQSNVRFLNLVKFTISDTQVCEGERSSQVGGVSNGHKPLLM